MNECLENIFFILGKLSPIILSGVAIILTFKYQKHSKKLANDRMLKELFTEFNQRYDKLNDSLNEAKDLHPKWLNDIKSDEKEKKHHYNVIIDFFNLCAEEYFWHKEGRINSEIWKSWSKGMNDIFDESPLIQAVWRRECEKEGYKSYYLEKPNDLFSSYKLNK